jgi:hypothetical protein
MLEVKAGCPQGEVEHAVEEDIRRFDAWFRGLGNDPIVRSEVAILKTYLWWKLRGGEDAKAGS